METIQAVLGIAGLPLFLILWIISESLLLVLLDGWIELTISEYL